MRGFNPTTWRLQLPGDFRSRLLLLVVALVAVVSAPVYLYVHQVLNGQLQENRRTALETLGISVASAMAEDLHERSRELTLTAENSLLPDAAPNPAALNRQVERLVHSRPFYSWIGFADNSGQVRVASGNLLLGADVRARPWFAAGQHNAWIGNVHEALLLYKLLPAEPDHAPLRFVDIAVPVHDAAGRALGVLAAHLNWRWTQALVTRLLPPGATEAGVEVLVVDDGGRIIHPASLFGQHLDPEGNDAPVWRNVRGTARLPADPAQRPARYLTTQTRLGVVMAGRPLGWRVVVRQPMAAVLTEVTNLQAMVLGSVVLAALLFLMAAWWTMGQVTRPLEQLVRYADQVAAGHTEALPESRSGSTEIRTLTQSVGLMASTLRERAQSLLHVNQQLEAEVRARTAKLQRANAALQQLAARDHLTGLHNRRAASERMQLEFARLQRQHRPYCVLLADIDHFKRINDSCGHAGGDDVLRQVAELLQHTLRESDFVARFGGEEFLVLLPETQPAQAALVAEKLRTAVARAQFTGAGQVTISIGISTAHATDASQDCAVLLADRGLYAAKEAGRNCVRRVARDAPDAADAPDAPDAPDTAGSVAA